MSFNFPLAEAIITAVTDGDGAPVLAVLEEMSKLYPEGVLDAPFLTNHDMVRISTVLDGDLARLRSAAAILLTLPGTPFIYYGEELGLANGPLEDGDPGKRTPMPWRSGPGGGFTNGTPWREFAPGLDTVNVDAQAGDPESLLHHYRQLIRHRRESAALRRGTLTVLPLGEVPDSVLGFIRESPTDRRLVLHNLADSAIKVGPFEIAIASDPAPFTSGGDVTVGDDGSVSLAGGASAVLPF
jgi:glycosidase